MVTGKKRYHMQQNSKADKSQARLGKSGLIVPITEVVVSQFTTVNFNMMVSCPICLYQAKLNKFLISTRKGISQKKGLCPDCKNGMMMRSLVADWSAKEYAKWVHEYSLMGFWRKCPFQTWKQRLYRMGWSSAFWDEYKRLKGGDETEDYNDDYDRQFKEYEESWNVKSQ